MIVIAATLYLPEHIAIMASRATFYWAGEETASAAFSHTSDEARKWVTKQSPIPEL
jgi:hypothetical protein